MEFSYCLEPADFAEMAMLRQKLTRSTPIFFIITVFFICVLVGYSAQSKQPLWAVAASVPLLLGGLAVLLTRQIGAKRKYQTLCKKHPSLAAQVQMRITDTELEWTMPATKPEHCQVHAVYPMAMFGAVFETKHLFAFAIPGTVTLLLPKRVLASEALEQLRELLQQQTAFVDMNQ